MRTFTLSTLPAPTAHPCRVAPLNNRHCNTSFSQLRLSSYLLLLIHTPRPASSTATLLRPNFTSHKLKGPAMPFPSLTRRQEPLPALPRLSPLTGRCSSSSCRADAGNSSAGTRLSVRVGLALLRSFVAILVATLYPTCKICPSLACPNGFNSLLRYPPEDHTSILSTLPCTNLQHLSTSWVYHSERATALHCSDNTSFQIERFRLISSSATH